MENVLALEKKSLAVGIRKYELAFYITASILIPFLLGHPQLLVGAVVNMILALAAFNLSWKKTLPIILLPSLAVALRGVVFGPLTLYLLYLTPAIWLGNSIFVHLIKRMDEHKIAGIILSSLAKACFLFLITFVLVKIGIVPKLFLTAMGVFQLATAIIGGALALAIQQFIRSKYANNKEGNRLTDQE